MAAFQAVPVRNTFVDIPIESEYDLPMRRAHSAPLPRSRVDRFLLWKSESNCVDDGEQEEDGKSTDLSNTCETPSCFGDFDGCWFQTSESPSTTSDASGGARTPETPSSCDRLPTKQDSRSSLSTPVGSGVPEPVRQVEVPVQAAAAAACPPLHAPEFLPCQMPVVVRMVLLMPVQASQPTHPAARPARAPSSESTCISWTMDADLLRRSENKVESQQFLIAVPGLGMQPFQVILYAVGNQGKRGSSGFERSHGHGRVEVRSLAQLPRGAGRFCMSIAVGDGERTQPPRSIVPHDFSERACCTWRRWDFLSATNPSTRKLTVQFSFLPPSGARA